MAFAVALDSILTNLQPSDVEPPSNNYPNQIFITAFANRTNLEVSVSNFVTNKVKIRSSVRKGL